MRHTAFSQTKPRLRSPQSSLTDEQKLPLHHHDEHHQNAQQQPMKPRKKGLWLFRKVSAPHELPSKRSNSEELELVSLWNRASSGSVLCIPPQDHNSDQDDDDERSISSGSSLSSVAEMQSQHQDMVLLETSTHSFEEGSKMRVIPPSKQDPAVFDLQQYMAKREMTPTQERWNAVTMIPGPLYCIYFLLSGCWLSEALLQEARHEASHYEAPTGCLTEQWWHHMPALPPLPVIAAAFGIIFHAPFSFLYHWKYAHSLPVGAARTTHWSRRMDQSMIHFASACMSYATSGSWDFFVANCLFNVDCIYRQFKTKVRPHRNKVRISISILAYTIPIVRRGDFGLFLQLWAVFVMSGWLFINYPIGGWSHAAFHLVIALAPPLLMVAALDLPASQEALKQAAHCAVAHELSLSS